MTNIFEYKGLKIHFRKHTVDEKVLGHSFDNDIFFPELGDLTRESGMTVIDIGAHIGTFSILSSLTLDQPKVFAVEPHPETFQVLQANIATNKLKNITAISAALNDQNCPMKLFLSSENWEHSITHDFNGKSIEVQGVTLQNMMDQNNIHSCDLIKMNCEGAEFKIIYSLNAPTLRRIKMMLILFHEDLVDSHHSRKALMKFLKERKFLVRTTKLVRNRGWIIAKNQLYYEQLQHNRFVSKIKFTLDNLTKKLQKQIYRIKK